MLLCGPLRLKKKPSWSWNKLENRSWQVNDFYLPTGAFASPTTIGRSCQHRKLGCDGDVGDGLLFFEGKTMLGQLMSLYTSSFHPASSPFFISLSLNMFSISRSLYIYKSISLFICLFRYLSLNPSRLPSLSQPCRVGWSTRAVERMPLSSLRLPMCVYLIVLGLCLLPQVHLISRCPLHLSFCPFLVRRR